MNAAYGMKSDSISLTKWMIYFEEQCSNAHPIIHQFAPLHLREFTHYTLHITHIDMNGDERFSLKVDKIWQ